MKQIVQIFLNIILIFFFACDSEEKAPPTVQDDEIVEVYVQISLIQESNLSSVDKTILIDKYLSEKQLTMEKINLKLALYRENPAKWRSFFMKVQSRLRELQSESREKTLKETELVTKIVDTVIVHTIPPILNAINDTVIKSSISAENEPADLEEPIDTTITIEDETIVENLDPSPDYPTGVFDSDELGIFSYVIQPGDNLSSLASLYDTETELLVMINGIVSANSIRIGQRIIIPNAVTNIIIHTISSGEALSKISKRYNSDVEQIIQLNQINNVNAININDLLYIPVRKTGSERNK